MIDPARLLPAKKFNSGASRPFDHLPVDEGWASFPHPSGSECVRCVGKKVKSRISVNQTAA